MRSSFLSLGSLLVLALSACGGTSAGDSDAGESCSASETRCSGNAFQECISGTFQDTNICAGTTVCSESLRCVECRPENPRTCLGDDIHVCNDDGTVGDKLQSCGFEQCQSGTCGGASTCDASGVKLIYVVDDSNNLVSFDPAKLDAQPFSVIGKLNCNAGTSLPDFGTGTATPFSMSVDRTGTAWVLYSSGEIFHASTSDASCQSTGWNVGSGGFDLFGMGFVSDAAGSDQETLYIAGASDLFGSNLGSIDNSFSVRTIGTMPAAEQSAELTGTGDGELYAYYPGSISTFVANLDKTNAGRGTSWDLSPISSVTAWAFAHWGGKFYIFATGGFSPTNRVIELDPETGNSRTVIGNSAYRVVGAGVSTCAPTRIE